MVIELVDHHLGFRRVKHPLTLEEFEQSRATLYIIDGDEHTEATSENWSPGDDAFTRIDLGQYKLIVDGVQVGYVSKDRPGAIMLTQRVDDATMAAIEAGVSEQLDISVSSQMPVDLQHVQDTMPDNDDGDGDLIAGGHDDGE